MRTAGNEGPSNPGKSTPALVRRENGAVENMLSQGDSKFRVTSGAAPHLDLPLLLLGLVSSTRKPMEDFG